MKILSFLAGLVALTSFSYAQTPGVLAVILTAYAAVSHQTDSTPTISACGPNRPHQIAVSRDLFRKTLKCGQWVSVYRPDTQQWHRYIVNDTMNARFTRRADIVMRSTQEARAFGVKRGFIRP